MKLLGFKGLRRFISIPIVFLALFLIGASRLLILYPITSTIHGYIGGFGSSLGENLVISHVSKNVQNTPSAVDKEEKLFSEPLEMNYAKRNNVSGACDLYDGKWLHDPLGPLYTNQTCPVITPMQNCQGNGRPDKTYENWRWTPNQCHLPRFDPQKFLQLMKGKTLAFIGDSLARNQMESMLCILWQVEAPKNQGNRHMQRWIFSSTSTTIARIWSSWLVHHYKDSAGIEMVHLDIPDEFFMDHIHKFDVIVISSGHWFAEQSLYLVNNTIVGSQLWRPPANASLMMNVNNMDAFKISMETVLSAMATHPNYTGLTILRSYSPDHYEGGGWKTGGSCNRKSEPAAQVVRNWFTEEMHKRQVSSFRSAVEKTGSASRFKLMDITKSFGFRHDGHPGQYRSHDPSKIMHHGLDKRPPSQDCLHWCIPGPVDTWNEMVLEIISREFDSDLTKVNHIHSSDKN